MKKYIFILLSSIVFFSSCSEHEGTIYQGEEVQALFFSKTYSYSVVEEEEGVFAVTLFRGNTVGAAEVDVTLTWEDESEKPEDSPKFKLVSNVIKFEDGQSQAAVLIEYDFNKLGLTDSYDMTLALTNPEEQGPIYATASDKAYSATNITVARKLDYEKVGEGTFTSALFGQSWEQPIYKAKVEGVQLFKLEDLYYEGYSLVFQMNNDLTEIVKFSLQPMGHVHSTYGMCYFNLSGYELKDNVLSMNAAFLVEYQGGMAALYNESASLVLPDTFFGKR